MAPGGKRKHGEADILQSDPDDSDYSHSAARPRIAKVSSKQRSKPVSKRKRIKRGDDESDDISESDLAEESFEEDRVEDEAPDINPETGRPRRLATKRARKKYLESDGDDESDDIREEPPPKRAKTTQPSLILKLSATPQPSSRRGARARSGSASAKRPPIEGNSGAIRRSSRIAQDDSETMVALTNSGHHADIVRIGTRSPEGIPRRALKGGKGVKKVSTGVITEEDYDVHAQTKKEPEQTTSGIGPEIAASREDLEDDSEGEIFQEPTDLQKTRTGNISESKELGTDSAVVFESEGNAGSDDDEEVQEPVTHRQRSIRRGGSPRAKGKQEAPIGEEQGRPTRQNFLTTGGSRETRGNQKGKKATGDESSDFEPGPDETGEGNVSDTSESSSSPRKVSQHNDDDNSSMPRRTRARKSRGASRVGSDSEVPEGEELAEEVKELRSNRIRGPTRGTSGKPTTRKRKPVDYRIIRPENIVMDDDGPLAASTPSKRARGGAGTWQRSLFSTYGPFGGAGGPTPVFGGPGAPGVAGAVDSDSSDDETMQQPRAPNVGGLVGMTPTAAPPAGFGLFPPMQPHSVDPLQVTSSTPANLGKIKDKQALADADPLGVDQNVNFDSVGGLQEHIDKLKEMVTLPLLYPEIFQRYHVTPPRGVLFHGPPGTGKTLLARALASSVSSHGRKVTFYMRKGADALSKWVGEAERQLRLLFEEARKTQPSIIFFDEIDGLAPVRSSKQEQIHASIVSTLLALMDGMDGRGQVIVIGATNRPDSIDPALRRPGRFDREFYFPLPNREGRRMILDIHTNGWQPPVPASLKDELADLTKGYGGADLRALCTEATLNAIQRRYPQIYASNEKLHIKPETINIAAKDFMISIKKIIPSSERAGNSGAAPLPKNLVPLLREPLAEIKTLLAEVLPQRKHYTALEEAQFEDAEGDKGMGKERMQQEFERSRVFRPRLLVHGIPGMGQQYLAAAILNHFEGLHVQSFDLPTLLGHSDRSPEAAIVQLFTEVRRHKPSVIYIPNVDVWYKSLVDTAISTFLSLLRSLAPTDPVLLFGVLECEESEIDDEMTKKLFGFSKRNRFTLGKPDLKSREEFFGPVIDYLNTSPEDFPDPADRKKRVFEKLRVVTPEPPKAPEPPTKDQLKAQKRKDRQTLNILKVAIQPIMDQIKMKFKKFRTGVIEEKQIEYLYEEDNPSLVTSNLPEEDRQRGPFRPYEKSKDAYGEPGLKEISSGKFYYNMEIVTIEKRLSNGYYKRPKDFLADIKKMTKDAKTVNDMDRLIKANELQANVEVDIAMIETRDPAFVVECEAVYVRERKREEEKLEKAKQQAVAEGRRIEPILTNVPPPRSGSSTERLSGEIVLGQLTTNGILHSITPPQPQQAHPSQSSQPSQPSTMTNGLSLSDLDDLQGHVHGSNGTSVPSRLDENTSHSEDKSTSTQRDSQASSFGPSAQARPMHTGLFRPGSLSQRSAITPLAEGSNPNMYSNDASTTSSDKRMTGSSGQFNTPSSNGGRREVQPDLSFIPHPPSANSELPDTQGDPSSQGSTQKSNSNSSQSSHPPIPPFHRPSDIHSLLNTSPPVTPLHPPLITDAAAAQDLLEDLTRGTSTCSVEQLEQVYSALMSELWRTRGQWDRSVVVDNLRAVFEDVVEDIIACQHLVLEGPRYLDD